MKISRRAKQLKEHAKKLAENKTLKRVLRERPKVNRHNQKKNKKKVQAQNNYHPNPSIARAFLQAKREKKRANKLQSLANLQKRNLEKVKFATLSVNLFLVKKRPPKNCSDSKRSFAFVFSKIIAQGDA